MRRQQRPFRQVSASDHAQIGSSWDSPILQADPSRLAARGVTAIMVWPFASLSDHDGEDARRADTLTDDLINGLSRFDALRVISRMTAFAYRGRNVDAAEVGAGLGVRYIVEGTVRSVGKVLRVNVELIDTASRLQVWGDHFERDEADRLGIQDEIATHLSRALSVGVAAALSSRPGEPEVAELLAKGLTAQFRGPQAENLNESRGYFLGALKRDPGLVRAMVGAAGSPDIYGKPELHLRRRADPQAGGKPAGPRHGARAYLGKRPLLDRHDAEGAWGPRRRPAFAAPYPRAQSEIHARLRADGKRPDPHRPHRRSHEHHPVR